MNISIDQPMILAGLTSRLRILFLFTLVLLMNTMMVDDASAGRSRTAGGIDPSDMHEHGIRVLCTWPEFEGVWNSVPDTDPVSPGNQTLVSHSVGVDEDGAYTGEYATCSGWEVYDDGSDNVQYIGDGQQLVNHAQATYGSGQFAYTVKYSSTAATTCIEDPNSGIGNNCVKFTDAENKKHGGSDSDSSTDDATLSCANNDLGGTTLTYQFFCADGVNVEGFLTLVPEIDGQPQFASLSDVPGFTQCGLERIARGECAMQLGGVPEVEVKIKGVAQWIVDSNTCLEAFPEADIQNALQSTQVQTLQPNAMLFYQETAYTGSCNSLTELPSEFGAPTAAYGRYCTSDIDTFADNDPVYAGDGDLDGDGVLKDGFDNQLRVCERDTTKVPPHVASHDVDVVKLTDFTVDYQPTLNLNCWTGNGSNDSGIYKVWIPDQGQLLASSVVADPLAEAPKLEGLSPSKAVIVTLVNTNGTDATDDDVYTENLELTYPTCAPDGAKGLAEIVYQKYIDSNETDGSYILNLTGDISGSETSLGQTLDVEFEIKVNGI